VRLVGELRHLVRLGRRQRHLVRLLGWLRCRLVGLFHHLRPGFRPGRLVAPFHS
jgi:hypothetical protein